MSVKTWEVRAHINDCLGRYEFVNSESSKFWECLRDGENKDRYATRWGAIKLTKTKHNVKTNMTVEEAAIKISEKINKGYRLAQKSNDLMEVRLTAEDAANLLKNTPKFPVAHDVRSKSRRL